MKSIVAFGTNINSQTILAVGDVAANVEYPAPVYLTRGIAENISTAANRTDVYKATLRAKGNIAVK